MTRSELQGELQRRTASHYESYPFDFMTPEDETEIVNLQPPPFRDFVETFAAPGQAVGEIGCGPGRGTLYLACHGLKVTAVDLSRHSLELARKRVTEARFVCASNLDLPFTDASFDLVVSDGVIHHTPDARRSFRENARILKPGGYLYLGVYNRHRYYYYIYTFIGLPIRRLERSRLGRAVIYGTLLPIYYLVHLVKSRGARTLSGARNFFYDYIITPQASFHTRNEVAEWASTESLDLVTYDPSLGNVHVFVFRKPAP